MRTAALAVRVESRFVRAAMCQRLNGSRVVALLLLGSASACSRDRPAEAKPAPPTPQANLETIKRLLAMPEEQIDFAKAKLTIDKMIDPTIDIEGARQQLDLLSADIWRNLPPEPSSRLKVEALRAHLYQAGPWNGHRPFAYDLNDPKGTAMRSKRIRSSSCVGLSARPGGRATIGGGVDAVVTPDAASPAA